MEIQVKIPKMVTRVTKYWNVLNVPMSALMKAMRQKALDSAKAYTGMPFSFVREKILGALPSTARE